MSGGNVAYHLRPNKAVERELFFDLLSHLQRILPIRSYKYISMGGPYMEDFRIAYRALGITSHISIESKEAVCKRQKFNSPIGGVVFKNSTMGKFIAEYESDGPAIYWLDYASADRAGQVRELQTLLGKVQVGDIVKITLNAEPTSIAPKLDADKTRSLEELAEAILIPLGQDFEIPEDDLRKFMKNTDGESDPKLGSAKALARYVKRRCGEALKVRVRDKLDFVPVTAFRYSDDRQQMLTLTAVVLKEKTLEDPETIINERRQIDAALAEVLTAQHLGSKDWEEIHLIDVPDLSVKEKLTVDSVPFSQPAAEVLKLMDQSFGIAEEAACSSIAAYRKFARYYPLFGRFVS